MKRILPALILALMAFQGVFAQDPHLSQFYMSPLTLNPALTGAFNGNYRLTGLFRSQWGSILQNESVPMYRTYTASADFRTDKGFMKGDAFGIGGSFMGDHAGEAKFGFNSGSLSLAYHKALDSRGTHFITAAFSSGIYSQSIDYSRLQFGAQWDGNGYDATLPTNEFLADNNKIYWDVNAGLLWYKNFNTKKYRGRTNAYAGFSAMHLNRPSISFLGDKNVRLNMKFVGHGGVNFPIARKFDLQPKFIVMSQGKSIETILAADFRFLFDERNPTADHVRLGAMFRMVGGDPKAAWRGKSLNAESVVLTAGASWMGIELGFAYDINVSELVAGSRTRGGFEVGLAYVGAWKKRKPGTMFCPRF